MTSVYRNFNFLTNFKGFFDKIHLVLKVCGFGSYSKFQFRLIKIQILNLEFFEIKNFQNLSHGYEFDQF